MLSHNKLELLTKLNQYFNSGSEELDQVIHRAKSENGFFTYSNVKVALKTISTQFLDVKALTNWVKNYPSINNETTKTIGIVMAGNIPLVGFHDFLCAFMSNLQIHIKLSSKDRVLWKHILEKMTTWDPELMAGVQTKELLKDCDLYIATGATNTSKFFEQYFGKFPCIIRKNRTSVAVLSGDESQEELLRLTDDILLYYGLGCRNVSKVYVPEDYDFSLLLDTLKEKEAIIHHHKYKNNYDYHLAIYLLNKVPYKTNEMILLVENKVPFAPIGSLHYEYYSHSKQDACIASLIESNDIQAIVTKNQTGQDKVINFGESQTPSLMDYADGVDTMQFLTAHL